MIWGQKWERNFSLQNQGGHWKTADWESKAKLIQSMRVWTCLFWILASWGLITLPQAWWDSCLFLLSHGYQTQFSPELGYAKTQALVKLAWLSEDSGCVVGQRQGRDVKKTNIQRVEWFVQTDSVRVCVQVCAACLWTCAPAGFSLVHFLVWVMPVKPQAWSSSLLWTTYFLLILILQWPPTSPGP